MLTPGIDFSEYRRPPLPSRILPYFYFGEPLSFPRCLSVSGGNEVQRQCRDYRENTGFLKGNCLLGRQRKPELTRRDF